MDGGLEEVTEEAERSAIARQAARVKRQALVFAGLVTVVALLG